MFLRLAMSDDVLYKVLESSFTGSRELFFVGSIRVASAESKGITFTLDLKFSVVSKLFFFVEIWFLMDFLISLDKNDFLLSLILDSDFMLI